jgi:hypothetical protein
VRALGFLCSYVPRGSFNIAKVPSDCGNYGERLGSEPLNLSVSRTSGHGENLRFPLNTRGMCPASGLIQPRSAPLTPPPRTAGGAPPGAAGGRMPGVKRPRVDAASF